MREEQQFYFTQILITKTKIPRATPKGELYK